MALNKKIRNGQKLHKSDQRKSFCPPPPNRPKYSRHRVVSRTAPRVATPHAL
jgi:hypothetical protein